MNKSVYISLKSGGVIEVEKFKYITYPSKVDGKINKVETFDNFYLYNRHLTFVGEFETLTLNASDIEFVKFYGLSSN